MTLTELSQRTNPAAALLAGPGVLLVAFALLCATTLLDRLARASTLYEPEPLAPVLC